MKQAKRKHFTKDGSHTQPDHVYAQEFAQIIAMIHQHESLLRSLDKDSQKNKRRIVTLLSISQNHFSMLVAEWDLAYYEFLLTGDEEKEPFLTVIEHGVWDLCVGVDVRVSADDFGADGRVGGHLD